MYSQKQSLGEFYNPNQFEHHFEKSFTLPSGEFNSSLEACEFGELFDRQEWKLDDLWLIEEHLFRVKSKLNNFNLSQWGIQTSKFALFNIRRSYESFGKGPIEVAGQTKPELFTRAWIKLYEILVRFNLKESLASSVQNKKQINSLFLCEAPG